MIGSPQGQYPAGRGEEKREVTKWHEEILGGDEYVPTLIVVIVSQMYTAVKMHQIRYFKCVL